MTPTYPGVYIQELPSSMHTIAGVATSITAFVGYTARGIDNRAEQIFSFADYERLFGGLASDSELSYAVQQFFQNGGNAGVHRADAARRRGCRAGRLRHARLHRLEYVSEAWPMRKVRAGGRPPMKNSRHP